jgi:hypothetical protein
VVVLVADFIALAADLEQLDLVQRIVDGERVPFRDLNASDDRVATTGILQTGAYVVCMVAFLTWYGRAYRNLWRLGAVALRFGPRWAVAYWFIPIVSLFRPKQVVNDLWRASDPELPVASDAWRGARVPALLGWWWALWLLSTWINNLLFRRSLESADTPDEFVAIAQTFVAWDVVDVIPAILAALVVWRVTKRQEERRRRYEAGELGMAPAPPPPPTAAPASATPAPPPPPVAPDAA